MRDRLAASLRSAFPGIEFNAPFEHALPTTLNFSVPDRSGKALLDLFDAAGVRVSAGSACSAAQAAPSYVLLAMGLPEVRCANAVRMSFGPLADDAFIDEACARIARCGQALLAPPPAACPVTGSGAPVEAKAALETAPDPVPCALDAQRSDTLPRRPSGRAPDRRARSLRARARHTQAAWTRGLQPAAVASAGTRRLAGPGNASIGVLLPQRQPQRPGARASPRNSVTAPCAIWPAGWRCWRPDLTRAQAAAARLQPSSYSVRQRTVTFLMRF